MNKWFLLVCLLALTFLVSGCLEQPAQCIETWSCNDWSECVDGLQTRRCIDLNDCDTAVNKPAESQECREVREVQGIEFVKKIEIFDAARPEIIATEDRVFVIYLGNISKASEREFRVKIFNSDLSREITSKTLVSSLEEYGNPTDIRVAADDYYIYIFYETASELTGNSYLFGEKYALSDEFEKAASTGLIASGKIFTSLEEGDERLDDPIALVGQDSVFTITRYVTSLEKEGETKYKVYEFTKDLSKIKEFDLDLSSIVDGAARQASAIYHNSYYYMAVPTTVGRAGPISNVTPSDILVIKLDTSWNIIESRNISTDNFDPNDAETYITGLHADNTNFYITYLQINIPKINAEFTSPLKIYNKNFDLVFSKIIKIREGGELRPSLEVKGNQIFIGHSAGAIGAGNAEIHVFELIR